MIKAMWGVWAMVLLAGCTYVNRPLNDVSVPLEDRRANRTRSAVFGEAVPLASASLRAVRPSTQPSEQRIEDADGYFVGIAISGGGLRSANFAAANLFQLQRLGLMQRVDYISSVSGGSIAAAYYCLSDAGRWNPRDVQEKLAHHFATDMVLTGVMPWSIGALLFSDYDSSDILAEVLDHKLFRRDGRSMTFGDLREDRPRLLINATDLQSGKRFVFCNETFDGLNSDLSAYPLAHAVAASGAFPVLLHDKTLRDFSTAYKQYRHFIDGGVTDNLGIQSLIEVYESQNRPAYTGAPVPYPHGAILIVIDAGTRYDAKLSDKGDISFWEEVKHGTGLSSTALLSRANSATMAELLLLHSSDTLTAEDLRKQQEMLTESGYLSTNDRYERPVKLVHLSLARIRKLTDVPFPSFSESIDSIATFYNIAKTEAYRLYQAADLLFKEPQLRQRLEEIAGELAVPEAGRRD